MLTQLAFVYSKSMIETQKKCTQKLTMKTPERRLSYLLKTPDNRWFSGLIRGYRSRRSGGFIVNGLNIFYTFFWCFHCQTSKPHVTFLVQMSLEDHFWFWSKNLLHKKLIIRCLKKFENPYFYVILSPI